MSAEINQSEWPRPMETCGTHRKDALKQKGHSSTPKFANEEAPVWMEMLSNHKSATKHLDHAQTIKVLEFSLYEPSREECMKCGGIVVQSQNLLCE